MGLGSQMDLDGDLLYETSGSAVGMKPALQSKISPRSERADKKPRRSSACKLCAQVWYRRWARLDSPWQYKDAVHNIISIADQHSCL